MIYINIRIIPVSFINNNNLYKLLGSLIYNKEQDFII